VLGARLTLQRASERHGSSRRNRAQFALTAGRRRSSSPLTRLGIRFARASVARRERVTAGRGFGRVPARGASPFPTGSGGSGEVAGVAVAAIGALLPLFIRTLAATSSRSRTRMGTVAATPAGVSSCNACCSEERGVNSCDGRLFTRSQSSQRRRLPLRQACRRLDRCAERGHRRDRQRPPRATIVGREGKPARRGNGRFAGGSGSSPVPSVLR
jgi:hypothetical protein